MDIERSLGGVAVIAPDVGQLLRDSGNTFDSLRTLNDETQLLVSDSSFEAVLDQGRVIVAVPDRLGFQRVVAQVRSMCTQRSGLRSLSPTLGFALAEVSDRPRPLESSASALLRAQYLALQSARLARASGRSDCDLQDLRAHFASARTKGAAGETAIVKSLYAIPARTLGSTGGQNGLSMWRQQWYRHTPVNGTYSLISDVHGTENGQASRAGRTVESTASKWRLGLANDLSSLARSYVSGARSFESTQAEGARIRASHNAIFDAYFDHLSMSLPATYRASGDGLIGYADSVIEVQSAFRDAEVTIQGRLSSGVAMVKMTGERHMDERRLELGLLLTKVLKNGESEYRRLIVIDGPLCSELRSAVLQAVQAREAPANVLKWLANRDYGFFPEISFTRY